MTSEASAAKIWPDCVRCWIRRSFLGNLGQSGLSSTDFERFCWTNFGPISTFDQLRDYFDSSFAAMSINCGRCQSSIRGALASKLVRVRNISGERGRLCCDFGQSRPLCANPMP